MRYYKWENKGITGVHHPWEGGLSIVGHIVEVPKKQKEIIWVYLA